MLINNHPSYFILIFLVFQIFIQEIKPTFSKFKETGRKGDTFIVTHQDRKQKQKKIFYW